MKLVIEIDEEEIEYIKKLTPIGVGKCLIDDVYGAIRNGRPLEDYLFPFKDNKHTEWEAHPIKVHKCKECKWLDNEKTIIGYECLNPNKKFRTSTAFYKYATTRACKLFEEKAVSE